MCTSRAANPQRLLHAGLGLQVDLLIPSAAPQSVFKGPDRMPWVLSTAQRPRFCHLS